MGNNYCNLALLYRVLKWLLVKVCAERLYMGKPVGKHDSRQEEIHELLVRKAREGKMVVRLKGGDPFLFGRGGEEAEFLAGWACTTWGESRRNSSRRGTNPRPPPP